MDGWGRSALTLTKCILVNFTAVREDRTPGGKHRHRRIRVQGHHGLGYLPDGSTTTTIVIPQVGMHMLHHKSYPRSTVHLSYPREVNFSVLW